MWEHWLHREIAVPCQCACLVGQRGQRDQSFQAILNSSLMTVRKKLEPGRKNPE